MLDGYDLPNYALNIGLSRYKPDSTAYGVRTKFAPFNYLMSNTMKSLVLQCHGYFDNMRAYQDLAFEICHMQQLRTI